MTTCQILAIGAVVLGGCVSGLAFVDGLLALAQSHTKYGWISIGLGANILFATVAIGQWLGRVR